jgi:hypothetical protein
MGGGNPFKAITRIVAPVVGGFLGGPLGAFAATAASTAATGGNRSEILREKSDL